MAGGADSGKAGGGGQGEDGPSQAPGAAAWADDCEGGSSPAGPGGSPLPARVVLSRELFEARLRGVRLASWEQLLEALGAEGEAAAAAAGAGLAAQPLRLGGFGWPGWGGQNRSLYGPLPEGASSSVVHCDPMHVFAWVATLLIEVCLWGFVAYFASVNLLLGLAFTTAYGVGLWLMVSQNLAPQLAGMLWPNLPCAVAAAGALLALLVAAQVDPQSGNSAPDAGLMLVFCILPATAAAAFWMRALPRDPDRAVLVSNLFVGLWAALQLVYVMCIGSNDFSATYSFAFLSLLLLGAAAMAAAGLLVAYPTRWSSVELVSWTLNVGCLAVFLAVSVLLGIPLSSDLQSWLGYLACAIVLGLVGALLGRTLPVLLSALGLATAAIYASVRLGELVGSPVGALVGFGVLGMAVVGLTQWLCRRSA